MSGHLFICTRLKERPPLGTSWRCQAANISKYKYNKSRQQRVEMETLTWLAWADLDGANLESSAGEGFKLISCSSGRGGATTSGSRATIARCVLWRNDVMLPVLVGWGPRALPVQRQKYCNICLLSPLQDLFRCVSWKKKGRMFHTPIDQGGGGAPLLFFLFSFSSTMRWWFSTTRRSDQPDEVILFNSERWTASRRSVAKQYYCCGTGERGRAVAVSTVIFVPWRDIWIGVKDAAGKSHRMGRNDVRYLIDVSRDSFFLLSASSDGNQ